jgi:N-acetylmuramoyl-L-alanine amidase
MRKILAAALATILMAQTAFGGVVQPSGDSSVNAENSISLEVVVPADEENLAKDVSEEEISLRDYPRTRAFQFAVSQEVKPMGYIIRATTPISRVDKLLLEDNRLVLDIHKADWGLDEVYEVNDEVIGRVRTESVELLGDKGTRVVFEFKKGARFSVYLTEDRFNLILRIERNEITRASFKVEEQTDVISVEGAYVPALSVSPAGTLDEVLVDMPMSTMKEPSQWITGRQFNFIKSVRMSQLDEDTARIALKVTSEVSIVVSYEENVAIIRLSAAEYKNMLYDSQTKTLRVRKIEGQSLGAADTGKSDSYNDLIFTVTLPGNFSELLGSGEMTINDDYLKGVQIKQADTGRTQLVIEEKRVLAFSVTEDTEYLYIKAMLPKEMHSQIVVVDPGHGASDPGAMANGLVEKDLNLDVSKRLLELIDKDGKIKAYATRNTDVKPDLYERPAWANAIGDLFVSIHMNAMGSSNVEANGTEVFYYPHENDSQLGFASKQFADIMQSNLLEGIGSYDRKVQTKPFVVIKYTTIPAVLCEIGFLTNKAEAAKIATADYRQQAAQSLYNGILEAFSVYSPIR